MMSENTELREQVRARYAQAATAVSTGTRNADLLVEETPVSSCCSSTPATEGSNEAADESCCAPTERSFGAGLYDDATARSEEHTSELQSRGHLVCRLLLENKKRNQK